MTPVRLSRAKVTIFICLLFAGYFVYTAASSTLRSQALRNEYGESTQQIAELEQRKTYLEAVLEYVASDAYVEQEARRRLGYIRQGEVPFVVTSPPLEEPTRVSGDWWERLFPANPPVLTSISRQVGRFIREERLIRKGARVMVALSGGPDSVATLLVLESLRETLDIELLAVHFDHQIRLDSKSDLEWCRALCNARGIPFYSGEGEVLRRAKESGTGLEAAARQMRYQFIGFVAGKERIDRVVTGHTADDQAETILMRVLRGSGVRGIRGMLPLAPLPGSPGLTLIRPLLRISRADTVALCEEAGIEPRIDASNTDIAYQRNRIRAEVLPALREISPGVDRALTGLGESAREAFTPIEKESMGVQPTERGALGAIFRLKPLAALPAEALTLVIEREATFFKLPTDVNRTRIKNLRAVLRKGSGEVALGEVVMQVSCGLVRLGPPIAWDDASLADSTVLNVPGTTKLGAWRVDVSPSQPLEQAGAWTAALDMSATKGVLRLRTTAAGDIIRSGAGHKKLSEWLIDRKIPAWKRHGMVVVADSAGIHAIIGMPPFGGVPSDENAFYLRATNA